MISNHKENTWAELLVVMADASEYSHEAKISKQNDGIERRNADSPNDVSGGRLRSKKKSEDILMPPDFKPSAYSVIIGRGKKISETTGNRRLRVLASPYLTQYAEAMENKSAKTQIVNTIVGIIKSACPVGAFVRKYHGQWYEVDDGVAREKVGYVFRDLLSDRYESSSKSKVAKKRQGEHRKSRKGLLQSSVVPSGAGIGDVDAPVQLNDGLDDFLMKMEPSASLARFDIAFPPTSATRAKFASRVGGEGAKAAASSSSSSSSSASEDESTSFPRWRLSPSEDGDDIDTLDGDFESPSASSVSNERGTRDVRYASASDGRKHE